MSASPLGIFLSCCQPKACRKSIGRGRRVTDEPVGRCVAKQCGSSLAALSLSCAGRPRLPSHWHAGRPLCGDERLQKWLFNLLCCRLVGVARSFPRPIVAR